MSKDIIRDLRKIRMEKGITQREFGAVVGYKSSGSLSLMESGRRSPNLDMLTTWANALDHEIVLRPRK